MHQQYSAEVAKVLSQLNSEDRKTATSKVRFQLHSLVKLCFSTLLYSDVQGQMLRDLNLLLAT